MNLQGSAHKFLGMIACVCILFTAGGAHAHRPHDPISDVAMSSQFVIDGTAFTIVADRYLKITRNHGKTWQFLRNGLDNIYSFSSISVSPVFHEDGTVVVSSNGDGVYISKDGGNSWKKSNKGLQAWDITKVIISPFYEQQLILLAADSKGNLYRMSNGANQWELMLESQHRLNAMDFLPAIDGRIYILAGDAQGGMHLHNGTQWSQVASNPEWDSVICLAVSPQYLKDKTYWIGTEKNGIFKTIDGGISFEKFSSGISDHRITSLYAHSHQNQTVLYATTWTEALYRSDDGGATWLKYDSGLSVDFQADSPNFLLPYFKGIAVNRSEILLGGFDGLFYSKDRGEYWRQQETWPISYISMMSLSPMDKRGHQAALLAYGGGAYMVDDVKSQNWVSQAKSLTLAGVPGRRTDSGVSDVAFSPAFHTDHTLFAATEHELIKSESAGDTWTQVVTNKPLMYRVRSKVDRVLRRIGVSNAIRLKIAGFFPLIPGWSTYIAISPDFSEDGTVFFGTQGLGQCLSVDHGKSCSVILDTALKLTSSMAISPAFGKDGTLLVGIRDEGIYKTVNRGDTFQKTDQGVHIEGGIKLVISPEYPSDGTVLAGTGTRLYISKDGGDHWRETARESLPRIGTIVHLAISPDFINDRTVFVAKKGKGIYKSVDGGKSFASGKNDPIAYNEQIKEIHFSAGYANDRTLFGVSDEKVYQSSDAGDSWHLIPRPVRYEDPVDVITFTDGWEPMKRPEYSDSTQVRSKVPGSRASLRFSGTGIRLFGEKSSEGGCADVIIDTTRSHRLSYQSNANQPAALLFEATDLENGVHDISVEVCDSTESAGWVSVDAFEIIP